MPANTIPVATFPQAAFRTSNIANYSPLLQATSLRVLTFPVHQDAPRLDYPFPGLPGTESKTSNQYNAWLLTRLPSGEFQVRLNVNREDYVRKKKPKFIRDLARIGVYLR